MIYKVASAARLDALAFGLFAKLDHLLPLLHSRQTLGALLFRTEEVLVRYSFQCMIALLLVSCATSKAGTPIAAIKVDCTRDAEGLPPDVWESSIAGYEAADAVNPPDPGPIVFVGSSSILFWETLADDMAPLPVLNRGFGGSTLFHVTHFADRIVLPYHPAAIVLYAGDNDIDFGLSAECTYVDFQAFVAHVRGAASSASIYFISIKPSPARWTLWREMQQANELIEALTKTDPTLHFIDVSEAMLDARGEPIEALYLEDELHMTAVGYDLWRSIIRPRLAADFGL